MRVVLDQQQVVLVRTVHLVLKDDLDLQVALYRVIRMDHPLVWQVVLVLVGHYSMTIAGSSLHQLPAGAVVGSFAAGGLDL